MATHLCAIKAAQPKIDEEGFTTVNPAKAAKATSVEETKARSEGGPKHGPRYEGANRKAAASSSQGVSSNTEQKKANQTQFEALKIMEIMFL